jgi:hypothetical protein
MGKKLVPHVISVGGAKVGVMLPDSYDSIKTVVGVEKTSSTNLPDVTADIKNLLRNGQVIRLRIRYKNARGKFTTSDILCDKDKVAGATADLLNKQYNGATILRAYSPMRAVYR